MSYQYATDRVLGVVHLTHAGPRRFGTTLCGLVTTHTYLGDETKLAGATTCVECRYEWWKAQTFARRIDPETQRRYYFDAEYHATVNLVGALLVAALRPLGAKTPGTR